MKWDKNIIQVGHGCGEYQTAEKYGVIFRFIPGISPLVAACFCQITVFGNESHAKSEKGNIFCCITELDIQMLIIYAFQKCGKYAVFCRVMEMAWNLYTMQR